MNNHGFCDNLSSCTRSAETLTSLSLSLSFSPGGPTLASRSPHLLAFFSTSLGLGTLHYAALACPFSQRDAACARVAVGGRLACAYCDMWRLEFSVRQRRLPPVAQNPLKSTSTTSTPGRSSFQQPAQCAHPHTLTPQGSSLQPLGAFHHFVPLASLTHGCVPRATAVAPQL